MLISSSQLTSGLRVCPWRCAKLARGSNTFPPEHRFSTEADTSKRRGPKAHYTETYPKSILGGLLFCGNCGARLGFQSGSGDIYLHASALRRSGVQAVEPDQRVRYSTRQGNKGVEVDKVEII